MVCRARDHGRHTQVPDAQRPPRSTARGCRAGAPHPIGRSPRSRRFHGRRGRHRRVLGRRAPRGHGIDDRIMPPRLLDSLLPGHHGRRGPLPPRIVRQPVGRSTQPDRQRGLLAAAARHAGNAADPAAALGRRPHGSAGQCHGVLPLTQGARHRRLDAHLPRRGPRMGHPLRLPLPRGVAAGGARLARALSRQNE